MVDDDGSNYASSAKRFRDESATSTQDGHYYDQLAVLNTSAHYTGLVYESPSRSRTRENWQVLYVDDGAAFDNFGDLRGSSQRAGLKMVAQLARYPHKSSY